MDAELANRLIEDLALAFRGEVTLRTGPIGPYPEMAFYHARHQVFVDLTMREDAQRLTLTMPFKPEPGRRFFDLRFFRPRAYDRLRTWLGSPDRRLKLLDQAGAFSLHAPDVSQLGQFLREGAAFRVRELLDVPTAGELAVAWTPARFLLQKPVAAFETGVLKNTISLSLRLIESLQDDGVLPFAAASVAAEPDPQIRTDGVVWDPIVGSCRVCGDSLHGRVVYCSACSTPHHPDCWEYSGTCAVYACGGTRAVDRMPGSG